jgi:hypothetical protein
MFQVRFQSIFMVEFGFGQYLQNFQLLFVREVRNFMNQL